jgi:cellulose synthase/poly-beta-1,6-N-acetylglucosamine synthase-like glycosyltransferase
MNAPGAPRLQMEALPSVTVQLPMFNEGNVAERIIEAAAAMRYPAHLLQIQVLDDSTDASAGLARHCCQRLSQQGANIEYRHRTHRNGFKAGALAAGLDSAGGQYIAVFDADFVPPADFLERTIHEFSDERVGMVQARWTHLNRDESLLTRVQALMLDAHFSVEQQVRHSTGRWFNFNGTAGLWRRAAIDDAGGWRFDTLTEDTDLSYRAQLRGWRFVYRDDVHCPAELPPTMPAFISQQNRWNKGLIETTMKLLPAIARSDAPRARKIEAWFHLTAPLLYPVLLALIGTAVLFTALGPGSASEHRVSITLLWLGSLVFGTISATAFLCCALWRRGAGVWSGVLLIPLVMAVCAGMSVTNTMAITAAVLGRRSPFIRTPKFNAELVGTIDPQQKCRTFILPCGWVELTASLTLLVCLGASMRHDIVLLGWPFMAMFAVGFAMIGVGSLRPGRPSGRAARTSRTSAHTAPAS